MRTISLVVALAVASVCEAATPQLRFAWKEVDYTWDTPESRANAIKEKSFIPENNLPLGLARWRNKMFVSIPRWKAGVASTLNYIDMDGPQDQLLKPYPSFKDNFVPDSANELPSNSSIISVFRMYVDACDRLWMVDTGLADILGNGNQVTGPSIVIFDLKTDQLIHRYSCKTSDLKEDSFFANIIVDVNKDTCDDAYAYIPDLGGYGVVVYSLKQDDSWRISHHYFHFEPLAGSYNVSGIEFQWTDGVFALALSDPREDGYRTVFFHAFSSTKEFCVSTELLRNYKSIDKTEAFHDFKLLGDRGQNTQSAASYYDPKTHVLFYTQVNRDGVACWNTDKPYTLDNNALIFSDPVLYEFPNDLKVNRDGVACWNTDKPYTLDNNALIFSDPVLYEFPNDLKVNRDGVACWNTDKPYTLDNNALIFSDPVLYEFPNDLKIDDEGTLWLLVDKLPRFVYKTLDPNVINYRIYSINTTQAIEGTPCQ